MTPDAAIHALVFLILGSCLAFAVVAPCAGAPSIHWLDHPVRLVRWFSRTNLFAGCLLFPISVSALLLSWASERFALKPGGPGTALAILLGAALFGAALFYRGILKGSRAASAVGEDPRLARLRPWLLCAAAAGVVPGLVLGTVLAARTGDAYGVWWVAFVVSLALALVLPPVVRFIALRWILVSAAAEPRRS